MIVEVEILGCVVTAQYGTLSQGDILRTNEVFAAHLVNDCKAAKYVSAPVSEALAEVVAEAVIEPEKKPRHKKRAE